MPLTDLQKQAIRDFVTRNNPQEIGRLKAAHPLNIQPNGGPCAMFAYSVMHNYVDRNINPALFGQHTALPGGNIFIPDCNALRNVPFGSVLIVWSQMFRRARHFVVYLDNGQVIGENHGGFLLTQPTNSLLMRSVTPHNFGGHQEFIYDEVVLKTYLLVLAMQGLVQYCSDDLALGGLSRDLVLFAIRSYDNCLANYNAGRQAPQLAANIPGWIAACNDFAAAYRADNRPQTVRVNTTLFAINDAMTQTSFMTDQLYQIF